MATPVSYLIRLANNLVVKHNMQFTKEQVELLEEAKWEVYKVLVSYNQRSNWFTKIGTPFNITNSTYTYSLPIDLYQLRKLVPENTDHRQIYFYKEDENSDRFQELERTPNAHPLEIPYTVIGVEPGTLVLAATPGETVAVKPWYVYKPSVVWDGKDDDIEEMPRATWLAIARYAATIYRLGAGSVAWASFRQVWADETNRMVNSDTRVSDGPSVVHGMFEDIF